MQKQLVANLIAISTLAFLTGCGGGGNAPATGKAAINIPASGTGNTVSSLPAPELPPGQTEIDASKCFNAELFVPGSVHTVTQKIRTPLDGSGTAEIQITSTFGQPTTYNQNSVNLVNETALFTPGTTTPNADVANTTTTQRYVTASASKLSVRHYGYNSSTQTTNSTANPTLTGSPFTPYIEIQFALQFGRTNTQSFIAASRTTNPDGSFKDITNNYTMTDLFAGVEAVTVPAGTFQACRFESTITYTPVPFVAGVAPRVMAPLTNWYGIKNGLLIKSATVENGGQTVLSQLKSATINGVAVTP